MKNRKDLVISCTTEGGRPGEPKVRGVRDVVQEEFKRMYTIRWEKNSLVGIKLVH
jgi:hypothetical protein